MSVDREQALDTALGQIERQFGKGSVMRMSDRPQVSVGRRLDRLARARPRARHRRAAARPRRRDLRPGVVGQDDARLPRDRRGAAARRDLRLHRRRARDGPAVREADRRQHRRPARLAARHRRAGARDHRAPDPLAARSTSSPIDSVAALIPKAEIEGEMGDSHVGLQARLMSQALRKLAGTLNRTDTICIFTNQLREKIGVMFGNPETTPGGRALKFYSSVRLDIRRIETLKEGVEAIGNRVRVKVVKNKVAPPFKQAEFDIIYGAGISWEGTVLDAGLERKVVQKSGSYFSFEDERLGQGRQNATAFLREHPTSTQAILAADPGAGRRRPGRLGAAAADRRAGRPGDGAKKKAAARRRPREEPRRRWIRPRSRSRRTACPARPRRPRPSSAPCGSSSTGARRRPRRRGARPRPRPLGSDACARSSSRARRASDAARRAALDALERAGYVDDDRFARDRAAAAGRARLRRRGDPRRPRAPGRRSRDGASRPWRSRPRPSAERALQSGSAAGSGRSRRSLRRGVLRGRDRARCCDLVADDAREELG